ncbi:hypothetical protein QYE76_029345 [Lolium multiflorum]|uniref:F-box domain-containing protein n=1 Tax=Lolium multiflorum TaxID=4521 RepID=A0AAD8VFE5_LOLMU|nr:hypothetical protein QYE76_029345 [Lolium multiflorum]
MSSLRRRPCSPSASSPLDDDDLLSEILLRLPPHPSSLPRASLVSKSWRLLISDPRFVRRFRIHHRRHPPLLGCFVRTASGLSFEPTMSAPNRVPSGLLRFDSGDFSRPLGCRHGLALFSGHPPQRFLVWDPVTGDQHRLPVPPGFHPGTDLEVNGAVLRAAGEGDAHFRVAFVAAGKALALACVYSSETGLWGDIISTPVAVKTNPLARRFPALGRHIVSPEHAVLVGDSLYWQLTGWESRILEFDLENQSLAVIRVPLDVLYDGGTFTITRAAGGGLGFLFVSEFTAQVWERNIGCDGVASWALVTTTDLDKLLSLVPKLHYNIEILGFAEENNVVFMMTARGVFAVQLHSLQFKRLSEFNVTAEYYPFESVYTAGL